MNKQILLLINILSLVFLYSCKEPVVEKKESSPKVEVETTTISYGYIPDYIEFTGKTIYINKSNLIAPINGYITNVTVVQGDVVDKGTLVFEMQSPESFLMQQKDSTSIDYGKIKIYSPVNGRIVSLNIFNKGVFADKGAVMCNIMASNNLKIQVNIPYEYNEFAKIGNHCKIILPDNSEVYGVFSKILPQVDEHSQTVKVLTNIRSEKFLPENMKLRVLVDKSKKHQVQILPKSCLQTDALMTKYWLMKLINDSIAVQIFVTTGNQNHDKVEILSPLFDTDDLFVSQGAYGLSDTVLVKCDSK